MTPPKWVEIMSRYFRSHALVVAPGAHVASSDCIAKIGQAFFTDPVAGRLDVDCASEGDLPPFVLE